jgi:hypothetical protein
LSFNKIDFMEENTNVEGEAVENTDAPATEGAETAAPEATDEATA